MSLGFGEIALILVVVLIVFGAGKLPNVMGDLGKGFTAFKRGMKDEETTKAKTDEKSDEKSSN